MEKFFKIAIDGPSGAGTVSYTHLDVYKRQGKKDGKERQVYIYQVADNQECVKKYGTPAVVAQTAVVPAIVVELVARGKMEGPFGVRVSEEFNPMPVLALLEEYEFPAGVYEMESEYREELEKNAFKNYLK